MNIGNTKTDKNNCLDQNWNTKTDKNTYPSLEPIGEEFVHHVGNPAA